MSSWGTHDLMAVCAVRYCLGRRSYIVGECREWLERIWPDLETSARLLIQRDVEEAIERDDKARIAGEQFKPLGMDMDRAEWERVRALWLDQPCSKP